MGAFGALTVEEGEDGTEGWIGTDAGRRGPALQRLFLGGWKRGGIPEKWDGKAGERIVLGLEQFLGMPGD